MVAGMVMAGMKLATVMMVVEVLAKVDGKIMMMEEVLMTGIRLIIRVVIMAEEVILARRVLSEAEWLWW